MDEQRSDLLYLLSRNIIDATRARMTPMEEAGYQQWLQNHGMQDSDNFNTREAYLAGLSPHPVTGHFVDWYKLPIHPTYSDGSDYADPLRSLFGIAPGTWGANGYVPSADNAYPVEYLRDFYWPRAEAPGSEVYTDPSDPEAVEAVRQALDRQGMQPDSWSRLFRAAKIF